MMRLLPFGVLLMPLPAATQSLSVVDCATYWPAVTAAAEGAKGVGTVSRELKVGALRDKVDDDTRRAIARLEDATANLQPALAEWSAAAGDLAAKLRAACRP